MIITRSGDITHALQFVTYFTASVTFREILQRGNNYENVRGILDCTELKCELPNDYRKHSEIYSDYKSHDTFKSLVCISPGGWITFVSQLYPGRISDKKTVEKSNFCQLIEAGDQYLADKGFEIHDLIPLKGRSLYIPPKRFSSSDRFTENQRFETTSIANVRIHVEQAVFSQCAVIQTLVKNRNYVL